MMTVQANPSRALLSISSRGPSRRKIHAPCIVSASFNRSPRVSVSHAISASVSLPYAPLLNHRRCKSGWRYLENSVFCMLGGKDFYEDENKGFLWDPIGKRMDSSGEKSIEDVLREQMEKKEYYGGGSGKKPPFFGFFRFFGFGDNHGDGSGRSWNVSSLDDFLQGSIAAAIFCLMYFFFLSGPEILLLCNDFIKYLSGKRPSVRLKKEMNKWGLVYQVLTRRLNPNKHWLEVVILNAITLFVRSDKYQTHRSEEYKESIESVEDGEDDRSVSLDDSDDEN